jgi:SAM-dependent methyltransferase
VKRRKALPVDYDVDPARFRAGHEAVTRWLEGDDVHVEVADRLRLLGARPVLDLGCGDGILAPLLGPDGGWIGLDQSPLLLGAAPRPAVHADAGAGLPFADASMGAVVALWMMYHLPDPVGALTEARRVLRPGGWFAACTTARDDSPELLEFFRSPPSPFDAEEAVDIVSTVFDHVGANRWDAPLIRLPDRDAVATYLRGRGVEPSEARRVADVVEVPMTVTKRGVLVWARAPG